MSFDQLSKRKKVGTTAASAPPKAVASPRNVPQKPPGQAPQTNVQDLKKFVQSDKKSEMVKQGKNEKPVEPKPATPQVKNAGTKRREKEKEKPAIREDANLVQQEVGRKAKDNEE